MSTPLIKVEERGAWALVTFDRADKRNAMNRQARGELLAAFERLRDGPRAIVLTGSGPAFCAGMDLKEVAADRERGVETANDEWRDVNVAMRQHPAVFIAAVNGFALGGGTTLINVCDLAIAAESAELGMPEIGFATYPGLAGPATQLSLSRKRAAWMVLTGKRVDARTAEAWGLVNRCVSDERLLEEAEALALHVAGFDAVALAAAKQALDTVPAIITDWRRAFDFGELTNAQIRGRTDAQRGGLARFSAGEKNPGQGRIER
ncbi:vanillin synthase /trans-feruloyl-CoA hydratase [Tistlia consotensis]|uniref:Vanillin synthase /trans-feruloyl-CoA hydratase n=1 Tax=Tistlia consotensis USBA 355 TaxID=560819 RepID=A0A1Y6C0G8_9PROT|nr:enoyl-CoA hydratase/isomerase family protein [Tistlia consotensis]SMF35501.1 vanillin synthase /trans-feruloyl-CoA hydratase [Tistlia consotensis USBA 355]SNR70817.1 vanillin synthase /trans-feruloyl-CoA hydratase [Tistlia consotensis]